MHTSTRKKLGVALIVLSAISVAVLHFSDVEFVRLMDSQTTGSMITIFLKLHWTLLLLGAVAFAGLLCLVLPGRRGGTRGESSP